MFGIEYQCGRKFGGWRMSSERFSRREFANAEIARQTTLERQASLTPIPRRAAPVTP